MSRKIEVFVSNCKVISGHLQTVEFVSPGHPCTARPIVAPTFEQVLQETHLQALRTAEKIARENGFKLKVYNTSSTLGKLMALLKGVKETPTIIINNKKFTGDITEEKLLSNIA